MGFRRIAIVNRGEPAMRLINAVNEYNVERGTDLVTIALYTDPDRHAMYVREADEAFGLGPAHVTGADGIRRVAYVDYDILERVLVEADAEAVWVGWGFVAEHARFAELCDRLGIVFLGPNAEVMRRLGDKITAKQIAEAAEVPVSPWSGGPVETAEDAVTHARRLGFPLLIKATSGGGGRGIRRVDNEDEVPAAFHAARTEAESAFGDGTLFLEKMVSGARHIEVQMVGDAAGTVWAVGVRDCSAQRRNQKIIEEAPTPILTTDQERFILDAAARLGRSAGYRSAGTVEFLFDPETGSFYFLEVNARLQVEHPVTELTTGVDLVKTQIDIGRGHTLDGDPPATVGYAIEARLNAEDPDSGFAPAPGVVDVLRLPVGPGLRIDTGVEEGDEIAAEFDSMVAKVIATGATREEARARLARALSQMRVVIRNGASNKAFLERILRHPDFIAGDIDVTWVDRVLGTETAVDDDNAGAALVSAAIAAYRSHLNVERDVFRQSAARGRPLVDATVGQQVELRLRGERYALSVFRLGPETWRVALDDLVIDATVDDLGKVGARLTINGRRFRVLSAVHGPSYYIEVDGVAHRITHDEGGVVRAPSPAVVVSLPVAPGDQVAAGDRLVVIEAMKMETAITAEFPGVVREVLVRENVQVGPGTPLLVVDAVESDDATPTGTRIDFGALRSSEPPHNTRCAHYLDELRRMLLGWDIDPANLDRHALGTACPTELTAGDLTDAEDALLGIFVDVISLFRRHPADDDLMGRSSSEEYLFNYLRDPGNQSDGLPADFVQRLERTFGHYGIGELDATHPEHDRTMLRIAKAHARMEGQTGPILRILEDRLQRDPDENDAHLRDVLERLIAETRGRYDAVHDIARELFYQTFDVPYLERARIDAYAAVEGHLAALADTTDPDERRRRIDAIIASTHSLSPLLSARLVTASPELQAAILEIIVHRRYRIRTLTDVASSVVDGFGTATAGYHHDDADYRLVMGYATLEQLDDLLVETEPLVSQAAAHGALVVVDLQVWRGGAAVEIDTVRDELIAIIGASPVGATAHRVIVTVTGPHSGPGGQHIACFTFRHDDELVEVERERDLHPMLAHRLELWRLDNFAIRRIPTARDIYLFHGTAYDNPKDERLFAFAEVRNLDPVRNEAGHVVRVPEFERVYRESLGSIRRFQARRPQHQRMHWNRAFLHVWPVVDFSEVDVPAFITRLAPETEGIGLERLSVKARLDAGDGAVIERTVEVANPTGREVRFGFVDTDGGPIPPMRPYDQKVVRLRSRGLVHPHELVKMLAPAPNQAPEGFPTGTFVEHDLDGDRLVPIERGPGENTANVVVGVVTSYTDRYKDGITRVIILGDPSRGMGSLAEAECRRIVAAIDLAEEMGVPLEWFAVSAGALISMDSGTENMDWIGHVLRRIVNFTQDGGAINVVVAGVNVGAQPYWNAEATMLMHTKGVLIMTPESAMVLTGKEALDYSGGVSAEDNQGIGGYERIMGPNGQAQYFARDLAEACRVLLAHYDYSYVAPGERFPRPAPSTDPIDRDVTPFPHGGDLATIGDVFSETTNPGRKRPFDMRKVMESVVDADLPTLERWFGMRDAEISVVWDAYLGGNPVTLIGFESTPIPRLGAVPADGPSQWTSGTLFPRSSKKTARAINAASGSRPVVILANLSGFDGSPESLRNWQLEYGAEIGRAIVNFDGPIVFCVVSRYHGGAFVVFSQRLNDDMEVAAVAGSHASVIGGAPAAAVVFAREVNRRADQDPTVLDLRRRADAATGADKARLLAELDTVRTEVHSAKLGEVAVEFDAIHNVHRAKEVGSVQQIVPPQELRPYLVDAVNRGIAKVLGRRNDG